MWAFEGQKVHPNFAPNITMEFLYHALCAPELRDEPLGITHTHTLICRPSNTPSGRAERYRSCGGFAPGNDRNPGSQVRMLSDSNRSDNHKWLATAIATPKITATPKTPFEANSLDSLFPWPPLLRPQYPSYKIRRRAAGKCHFPFEVGVLLTLQEHREILN